MKKLYLILLAFIPLACQMQGGKENNSIHTYNDSKLEYRNIRYEGDEGPTVIKNLKDSGVKANDLKQGLWSEYTIDSTSYGKIQGAGGNTEILIKQEIGKYENNKREGVWLTYLTVGGGKLYEKWRLLSECNYKSGLMDSLQVFYYPTSGDTDRTYYYKNGKLNGICKVYFANHSLKAVFFARNDTAIPQKQYYEDGKLKYAYSDSIINNVKHRLYKLYSDSISLNEIGASKGFLEETGFEINDTLLDGVLTDYYPNGKIESTTNYLMNKREGEERIFYDNGKPWTTYSYKNDKLWNVVNNFNKEGKKVNSGTLKDGNGTLLLYNDDGSLRETEHYKNGKRTDPADKGSE